MKSDVSIVIPTWNGLELLKRFLLSVIAAANHYIGHSGNRAEILVVDDGSTDETISWLQAQGAISNEQEIVGKHPPVVEGQHYSHREQLPARHSTAQAELRFLRNEKNAGFGEACNNGVKAARYPLIYLLNNDVEVARDVLAPLVEHFTDESVFAAHSRVYNLETGEDCGNGQLGYFSRGLIRVHLGYRVERQDLGEPFYSIYANGGSSMFDRRKFLELGGFNPLFSPFYWEDVELGYKAWKRGYTIHYEPRSVVRHRISSTTKKLDQGRVRMIQQRNRIIYHWLHLHDRRMFFSHILWITAISLLSPVLFKPRQTVAFFQALKRLPEIRKFRREEQAKTRRTDREVFSIFQKIKGRADVSVIGK